MSNEAAKELRIKLSDLQISRDEKESEIKESLDVMLKSYEAQIADVRKSLKEVCTHEGQHPDFVDDTYFDYHNRVDRGSMLARCAICGTTKRISQYDFLNRINPFK